MTEKEKSEQWLRTEQGPPGGYEAMKAYMRSQGEEGRMMTPEELAEEARILFGDSSAPKPLGVINSPKMLPEELAEQQLKAADLTFLCKVPNELLEAFFSPPIEQGISDTGEEIDAKTWRDREPLL